MSDFRKKYNPVETQVPRKNKTSLIQNEVRELLKKNRETLSKNDVNKLRNKYKDEALIDSIRDGFSESLDKIKRNAKKFYKAIMEKYGSRNYPVGKMREKAYKHKVKKSLSDAEFQFFVRYYEDHLFNKEKLTKVTVDVPKTNLSRVLGEIPSLSDVEMKLKKEDFGLVNKIKEIFYASKSLHAQVVFNSLTYNSLSIEAMTGKYKQDKHNPNCHIHPVVFALFIHKIPILDEHMLIASIPYIIMQRYKKSPITTRPDHELFYDLITDPNDVVCHKNSPLQDLFRRCEIQQQLWNAVLNLRNGRYYECDNNKFLMAIDQCRVTHNESPDLLYTTNEVTVLRRLLSAFSFRPTIISTNPLYSVFGQSSHNFSDRLTSPQVHSMQMIEVSLPYNDYYKHKPVHLTNSLGKPQVVYNKRGFPVPKQQNILYSRDVIIFYVNRRLNHLNISKLTSPYSAYQFNNLPINISGFERLNDREVEFDEQITISGEEFYLKSVVCVEVSQFNENIIIGNSTIIIEHADGTSQRSSTKYYYYNPRNAARKYPNKKGDDLTSDNPITIIPANKLMAGNVESVQEKAGRRGSIFIYANGKDAYKKKTSKYIWWQY